MKENLPSHLKLPFHLWRICPGDRYGFLRAEHRQLVTVVAGGHGDHEIEVDNEGTMTLDEVRICCKTLHYRFQRYAQRLMMRLVIAEETDVGIVCHGLYIDDVFRQRAHAVFIS